MNVHWGRLQIAALPVKVRNAFEAVVPLAFANDR